MFDIGDIVAGIEDSPYTVTNYRMTRGEVTEVNYDDGSFRVCVLEHERTPCIGGNHSALDPRYFTLVEESGGGNFEAATVEELGAFLLTEGA